MKLKAILLIYLLLPFAIYSQVASKINFKIKGTVSDSSTLKTIPFATVSIFKLPENIAIKRLATEADGSFETLLNDTGSFRLSIQMIGYALFVKEFSIKNNNETLDLGNVIIAEAIQTIGEVSVVADKPLIKVDSDKITYSNESDPESKTSNVLDMLRKVPLVSVDGDDNIQLKGASNFKIFINGKPSSMLSNNPKDVLKNMPASTVKDIEVITSPGAKYDAEGIGGIINIITLKKSVNGYNCSINMGASNRVSANSSINFTASFGKFAFSTNLSGNYYKPVKSSTSTYRENFNIDNYKYTYYNGSSDFTGISPWGNGEASYEIDTLNLISVSFDFWYGKRESNNETDISVYDVNNQMVQSYLMIGNSKNLYGSPEGNIDYQHTFKRNKEQILTLSYKFSHNPDNNSGETEYVPIFNYYQMLRKSSTEAYSLEQTFQSDYVHPFSGKFQLELGTKYIRRQNKSFSEYFLYDYNLKQYIDDMESNDFDYTQQIMAAYSSVNFKFKKLSLKTGVRMENSITDGSVSSQDTSFTNKSLEFVPTVNISYQLSQTQNLKLTYNMRIQRPDIWYLNPYINQLDNKNIDFGNPNLKPERYHNLEFNYGRFGKMTNLNLTVYYSYSQNSIQDYSWMIDTVTYTSYYNLGKIWSTGCSLYGSIKFGTKFTFNLSGSARYSDIESTMNENLKSQGWGGNFNSNFQYSLNKSLKFSVYGGMYFSGVNLQSKGSPYYYSGISINKMFFKDKLTVSISARNPFWKEIKRTWETTDPNFYIKNVYNNKIRFFGINLSLRFGEMKGEVKKAQKGIQNDDVKAGGNGGGDNGGK
jgi:outer membrane receptor protein involved in Fe transport